jgi:NAD(P)-dependent dehydrogenase (short-subunit alcohol dehydrogenase family)
VTAACFHGAVLITGASTGIGAACAVDLDRRGFRVFAGVRQPAHGDALRARASTRLAPVLIDVSDAASIAGALATVTASTDTLAGLVNNAGIVVAGPLELLSPDDLRQQLEVNVIGVVAVTRAFLPLLRRGRGRIVNVGSISGRMATPALGAYSASKFALGALTDSLRVEVQPWGIDVALVEPGPVATPIWQKGRASADARRAELTADAGALYGDTIAAIERVVARSEREAVPAEDVARVVAHALTAPRPKTRYLVGRRTRIRALFARLPDRLRDRLMTLALGLPKRDAKTRR